MSAINGLLANFICFVFYSGFICGCHFHSDALLFALLPIALNSFGIWKGVKEKKKIEILVWGSLFVLWAAYAWSSNARFYFNPPPSPQRKLKNS